MIRLTLVWRGLRGMILRYSSRVLIQISTLAAHRPSSRVVSEVSWMAAGQLGLLAAGIVSVRVLTEYLDPTSYGQFALALTLAQLVIQTMMGGLAQGYARFFSIAAEANDIKRYLREAAMMMAGATLVIVILGAVAWACLNFSTLKPLSSIFSIAVIYSVIGGWNSTLGSIQNAARHRNIVVAHTNADSWIRIAVVALIMLALGASAHSAILGYTISASAVFVSQIAFLYFTIYARSTEYGGGAETTQHPTSIRWKSRFWAFSWPFSAWGIFTWLQQASDRWSLQILATTHDVGSYAPVYQLGFAPISMASGVAMAVLAPIIYQRSGDASDPSRAAGAATTIRLVAAVVFCLTLCGFAFLSIAHRWLFSILVGEQFRTGSFLLPWMFLAGGTFATGQILSLKQMSDVQVKRLLAPKIATAVVGLALNFVGAALAGIAGVVFAMTTSAMIYTVWLTYLSFRDHPPKESHSDPASLGS